MPTVTAITTCKGRLEHLKASLPALMALPDCEVVVVDYGCPEGAGGWVEENHPAARVVRAGEQPVFNLSKARNLGAAGAMGEWLLFLDADVMLGEAFAGTVWPMLAAGGYLRGANPDSGLNGSAIVPAAAFRAIGGYDEVFEGWGSEDVELYGRLALAGVKARAFPDGLAATIPHDNALRARFHADQDLRANSVVNALYGTAKLDLMRQGLRLDEAQRRELYGQARTAAAKPDGVLEVTFRRSGAAHRGLTARLRYVLEPET